MKGLMFNAKESDQQWGKLFKSYMPKSVCFGMNFRKLFLPI